MIDPALFLVLAAPLAVLLLAVPLRKVIVAPGRLPPPADVEWAPLPQLQRRLQWRLLRRHPPTPTDSDVAAWCERVAAGLRSGRSLTTAVIDADEATDVEVRPFPDVVHAVRRGRSLGDALRAVDADPSTPTGLAAPVLATCADLGGAGAGPVEAVADVLLARATERAERLAASAQARLSARVLTTLPLGVAGLLTVAEPSVRGALSSPAGAACVAAGLLLNLGGWCWMRAMIGGAS